MVKVVEFRKNSISHTIKFGIDQDGEPQAFAHSAGEHGNAWDEEQTGEDGFSRVVDTLNLSHFAIMGQVDANTDIKVWLSQDGIHFYYSEKLTDEITLEEIPVAPDWEEGETYKEGDLVQHEVEGDLNVYSALRNHKATQDNQPPDEDTWELTFEDVEGDYPQVLHVSETIAARYIQLQSANDVMATITIVAKP